MDHTTVSGRGPVPALTAAGLSHQGPRYSGAGGHPNSYVARTTFTSTPTGTVSYDKNPLDDRFGRLARYEGLVAVIANMMENPGCERVQRLGCYAIAQQGGSSWAATLKTAHLRCLTPCSVGSLASMCDLD